MTKPKFKIGDLVKFHESNFPNFWNGYIGVVINVHRNKIDVWFLEVPKDIYFLSQKHHFQKDIHPERLTIIS